MEIGTGTGTGDVDEYDNGEVYGDTQMSYTRVIQLYIINYNYNFSLIMTFNNFTDYNRII